MNILWLSEITQDDSGLVGNKAVKLSDLYKLNIPVPQAFVITSKSFKKFLENSLLSKQIYSLLGNLDVNNFKLLHAKVDEIREIIMKAEFPEKLKNEIFEAYDHLNINEDVWRTANKTALDLIRSGRTLPYVSIRSSIINQYNSEQVTYLNVKGISSLITNIKKSFASLFSFDNIYSRVQNGVNHEDVSIAVIIQRMINSEKSGLVFVNKQDNEIKIEAINGMSELLLSKLVAPNYYVLDNEDLVIKNKVSSNQDIYLTRDDFGNNVKKSLDFEKQKSQTLTDYEINNLALYYKKISKSYNKDIQIEFAVENSKTYIINVKEAV